MHVNKAHLLGSQRQLPVVGTNVFVSSAYVAHAGSTEKISFRKMRSENRKIRRENSKVRRPVGSEV